MINLMQQLRLEAATKYKKINVKSGDVIMATFAQYKNKKKKHTIKGVCLGVSRRIGYSNIRLRNIIGGEGVEQRFMLESPLLLELAVTGTVKKGGRSKKYYLKQKSSSEMRIN